MRDDPTRARDGGREAHCTACGGTSPLPAPPVPLSEWTAAAKAFVAQHQTCPEKTTSVRSTEAT